VLAHDWLDGFGGLVGVVKGDGADVVVENVSFNDTVEKSATNKSEFTINGCGGTTDIVPASSGIVRKRRISVLEVGDGN